MPQNYQYITTEMFAALKPGDMLYCHTQLTMYDGDIASVVGELYPITSTAKFIENNRYCVDFSSLLTNNHRLDNHNINEWFGMPLTAAEIQATDIKIQELTNNNTMAKQRNTTIYIASSWKNQHAVEMLTNQLRLHGYQVRSFVENNYGEGYGPDKAIDFEQWVKTDKALSAFMYDMSAACTCDITIYLSPSGKDAIAEAAMCFAKGKTLYGLWAKGEDIGLMRKMFNEWFYRYDELLEHIYKTHPAKVEATPLEPAIV